MEQTTQALSYQWWRWPLVPIAAVGAAVVGGTAITLLYWLAMKLHGSFSEDGWFYLYVLPVLSSALSGYLYTLAAAITAPRGRAIATTVMVSILGVFLVFSTFISWVSPHLSVSRPIQVTIWSTAALLAAIITLVQIWHSDDFR